MSLIFITGNAGSGKSAIRSELQRRGYEAHDTDEDDISTWQDKSGQNVKRPMKEQDRTNAWYSKHDWNMSRSKIENLAKLAHNKPVFLCGSTSNSDEMVDLFDKIYYLSIDKDTLTKRLLSRTSNDFGKAPDELNNILGWHISLEETFKSHNAHLLDASMKTKSIVDEIIRTLK